MYRAGAGDDAHDTLPAHPPPPSTVLLLPMPCHDSYMLGNR
jgi:hypothetical protein